MKAIWNGKIIAESNETKQVEENEYFPPESVNCDFLKKRLTHTECAWKGIASYYHLEVDGRTNKDAT